MPEETLPDGGLPGGPSRRAMRWFAIIAAISAAAMIALVGWALWTASRPKAPTEKPRFDRFETAWSSAMSKAGVEATFPAGPVPLQDVRFSGRHAFETTFTAEEIAALLNVYRHAAEIQGSRVELRSVRLTFRDDTDVRLSGALVADGDAYSAEAEGPVAFSRGRIRSERLDSLTVEGFSVGGARRRQALDALLGYFNEYLDASPGLTVESAGIGDGVVLVRGFAPDELRHPSVSE